MTSWHKTGAHPFYIGMYIHIYTHIYVHKYTSQKECLHIFGWNCEHGTSEPRDHDDPQHHVTGVGKFFCPSSMVDSETQGVQYYAVLAIK